MIAISGIRNCREVHQDIRIRISLINPMTNRHTGTLTSVSIGVLVSRVSSLQLIADPNWPKRLLGLQQQEDCRGWSSPPLLPGLHIHCDFP